MNTDNYAWIVPEDWIPLMNSQGGVSSCYTIPVDLISNVECLSGAIVYIIVRGRNFDFLFARVAVDSVAVSYDDEGRKINYILNVCLEKSLRLTRASNYVDYNSFRVPKLLKLNTGFTPIEEASKKQLDSVIQNGFKFLFTHVPEEALSKISPPFERCGSLIAPIVIIREVISNFSLAEMWGSRRNPHPVANFACQYLETHPDFLTSGTIDECVRMLKTMPIFLPENQINAGNQDSESKMSHPTFQMADISLVPIDPKEVKARVFVPRKDAVSKESIMRKTEAAEQRHQEMLRDISSYFLNNSVVPYQSNSIDLAIKANGKTDIFELKSISESNLLAQASKGIFQLLYYSYVLDECGVICGSRYLVVEAGSSFSDLVIVAAVAASAGAKLMVYDSKKEWPGRLSEYSASTPGRFSEYLIVK